MIMVTTADLSTPLKPISYKELSDTGKAARKLRRELKDVDVIGTAQTAEADQDSKSNLLAEQQNWTNHEGASITAAIVSATNEQVTFLMPNRKSVQYPIDKLSAASQEQVRKLLE